MNKFKVDINKRDLKAILGKINARIEHNVKQVLLTEALPDLVERIMVGFDELSERADMLPEDPTNPGNWREEFREALLQDIYETFEITGGRLTVRIGEKRYLGYGANDSDSDSPLQWMVYYLEGLAGDWAFISPETYQKFRPGQAFSPEWGRFGQGFMISREAFEQEGWDRVVAFAEVRHPFSGYAPVDIFTEAVREFRFGPYIKKAISAAAKGIEL